MIYLPEQIELRMTCHTCPEQYEAYIGDRQVGYLRLRHGLFRVDFPECSGETIFEGDPEGYGNFEDHERDEWLQKAKMVICQRLSKEAA